MSWTSDQSLLALCLAAVLIFAHGGAVAGTHDFSPPQDEYDWLQLTSGEWLKGELIALYDDSLEFDSDGLGLLRIDWEDVLTLHGHGQYSASIEGQGLQSGYLQILADEVLLDSGNGLKSFPREQLVSITPSATHELDNWSIDVSLGFNLRKGNTETVEYNLLASSERRTPRSRLQFDYLGNYNESDGERVANNHRVNGSWDLFRGGKLFWRPLLGQYFRDSFQNIEHQVTLESGLGYQFIDTPRTDWLVSGAVGVNTIRYRSVEAGQDRTNHSPALTITTDYETELTTWLDYMLQAQATLLDEDSGRYQQHLLMTLSTELTGRLDLDVSLVWDRIENPQVRADGTTPERDDFRLMVGLGYEF